MLELLRRYLGDYVAGLDREALRISVWKGKARTDSLAVGVASWKRVPPVVSIAAYAVGTHRAVSQINAESQSLSSGLGGW